MPTATSANVSDLAASYSAMDLHSGGGTSTTASVPCTPAAAGYSHLYQQRSLHTTNPQAEGCDHGASTADVSTHSPPCTPAPAVAQGRFASSRSRSPLSHSSLVHSPDATAAGVVYPYSAMRAAPAASLSFLSPICATPGGLADDDERARARLLMQEAPTPSFAHCSPEAPAAAAGHAALAAPAADQSVNLSDISYWLADLQHRNQQMQQQLLNTSRHLQNLIPSASLRPRSSLTP